MNDADIKAAEPGAVIRDHVVTGLQLRAFAGRKAFYLYYRTKGGRERKPKLGDWPGLTLVKARRIAREMLDEVAAGRDPQGDRLASRAAPTVADLCDRYMLEHGAGKKSANTDTYIIDRYIKPKIGREPVAELDYDAVYRWHKGITAKVKANRALALLSTALNMAERWKWRPLGSNPCQHVKRNPEQRRRRYMTADEAAAIERALQAHVKDRPQAVAFIYLLIYTGARKGEIAAAKWSHIQDGAIRLPDSKTGHPRTIHLPPQVAAVLDTLPRTTGTITGIAEPYKLWFEIRKAVGCPDLRLHDLRHSFASAALAAGLDLAQIGELLGHKSTQTTKGYAHLMEETGKAAAKRTADFIWERSQRT